MQIFASGEGRKLSAPDEFLPQGSIGKVIGLIDLGQDNGTNDFGWTGLKPVIDFEGNAYVLDFAEHTRLVTDDGIELTQADAGKWEVGGPIRAKCNGTDCAGSNRSPEPS